MVEENGVYNFTEKERRRLEMTALLALYDEYGDEAIDMFRDADMDALDSGMDDIYYCVIPADSCGNTTIYGVNCDPDAILQTFDYDRDLVFLPLAAVIKGELTVFDFKRRAALIREVREFMRDVEYLLDDKECPGEAELLEAINAEMWCEDTTNEGEMCTAGLRIEKILDGLKGEN